MRAESTSTFSNSRAVILGALTFTVVSLLIIRLFSLDMLGKTLETHMQFLDIPLLREMPLQSILYTHSQPPLLNVITWILSLLPTDLYLNFIIINTLCSYFTGLVIYAIAKHYLCSKSKAWFLTALYWISPAAFLYTTYPFYPCLTAIGYSGLVYSFFIAAQNPRSSLKLIVVCIIYLCLLRSSFTILHGIAVFITYYFYCSTKPTIRTLTWASVILVISIGIVPAKNFILYDFFGSSSWGPLNVAKGMGIHDGLGPFPLPEAIREKYPNLYCDNVYGIQDKEDKRRNGQVNFNSCYLIEYAKIVKRTLWESYNHKTHLKIARDSSFVYFSPPEKYPFVENRVLIASYANAYNGLFMVAPVAGKEVRLLLFVLLVLSGYFLFKTRDKFIAVSLGIVIVHFFSHVLVDGGESSRFVFDIEFIFWIFLAIIIGYTAQSSHKIQPTGMPHA
jgi:hypothetical protein